MQRVEGIVQLTRWCGIYSLKELPQQLLIEFRVIQKLRITIHVCSLIQVKDNETCFFFLKNPCKSILKQKLMHLYMKNDIFHSINLTKLVACLYLSKQHIQQGDLLVYSYQLDLNSNHYSGPKTDKMHITHWYLSIASSIWNLHKSRHINQN